eukprot:scaffold1586_cov158-Amphora_coffeaeformis.AAC.8
MDCGTGVNARVNLIPIGTLCGCIYNASLYLSLRCVGFFLSGSKGIGNSSCTIIRLGASYDEKETIVVRQFNRRLVVQQQIESVLVHWPAGSPSLAVQFYGGRYPSVEIKIDLESSVASSLEIGNDRIYILVWVKWCYEAVLVVANV